MKLSKLLSALCILVFIAGCSVGPQFENQTQSESNAVGHIAFPVLGEQFMGKRSSTAIGVEVMLKNQKTGQVYKSLMDFKLGKRVEVMANLAPGMYVMDEYNEMVMGGLLPRRLKPAAEIVVGAGQTVLSPVFVRMTADIYPRSGVGYIQEDGFWDEYR
ncbi:MAG: hypothetical protein ACI8SR_000802 [Oceanicoccus sp.]|jgi:hypothetical protein